MISVLVGTHVVGIFDDELFLGVVGAKQLDLGLAVLHLACLLVQIAAGHRNKQSAHSAAYLPVGTPSSELEKDGGAELHRALQDPVPRCSVLPVEPQVQQATQ